MRKKKRGNEICLHVMNNVMDFAFSNVLGCFFESFLNDHLLLIRDATYNYIKVKNNNNAE